MSYRILRHTIFPPDVLARVASVWNDNAVGRHAFHPWTDAMLSRQLAPAGTLLTAHPSNRDAVAGFAYCGRMREEGYAPADVVEMLMVDAGHRNRGVGAALLDAALEAMPAAGQPRPVLVDALGAWPFGYAFNTLADGSERSGVFLTEPATYRLFRRAGFEPVRKSVVMRAELAGGEGRPVPPGTAFHLGRRAANTWLDRVFRGRELWDHDFCRQDGRVLSRSIFGFMEGESKQEGRAIFSLFGVGTPPDMRGKGYAGVNLSHAMRHVRDLGGEVMELHVYADNTPAMRLYAGLGFRPVAETVMMHKRCEG